MVYLLTDLSSNCSDYALAATLNLVHIVINVLQIITPIVLILSLAIVFVRNLINPEDKKTNKRLFNVILAAILCFLIPTILNILLSIVPDHFVGLDINACWVNAYNVDYSAIDRSVGVGMNQINLKVNFNSLKNAQVESSQTDVDLVECGGVNAYGKKIKCISGSGKNIDVVNEALKYEGYPYVWGAHGPSSFDCSGFVSYVYGKFQYTVTPQTGSIMNEGKEVSSLKEAEPGDLLVRDDGTNGHVAMYIGNNQVIHAKGTNYGVVISPVSEINYMRIRRII